MKGKRLGLRRYAGLAAIAAFMVAACIALVGASTGRATSSAAFTTVNESVDGTGHCKNGNPAVNCNIYDGKQYVWMNGGPLAAALGDGSYFFAVIAPGGQADPRDGSAKNLSDDYDAYTNRTFTVTNGAVSYIGDGISKVHDSNGNEIRLMPYADTPNPGGVYVMAICSLAEGYANVNPADCKYDSFKIRSGEEVPPAAAPTVTKNADGSYTDTYTWQISKDADKTEFDSSDGSATFKYTVNVSHDGGTASDVHVTGTIDVVNPNIDDSFDTVPIHNVDVTDQLSDGTTCDVTGGKGVDLTNFDNYFNYSCSLDSLPSTGLDNTVTATWGDQSLSDGTSLTANSATFTFTGYVTGDHILFNNVTNVDDCVDVTDPNADPSALGKACASDADNPTSFSYEKTYTGDPVGTCTSHDNTATFTTNSSQTTDTASKTVQQCVGTDLTVSKTAATAFDREYKWTIDKSVVGNSTVNSSTSPVTFNYSVVVDSATPAYTDSGWTVSGTITVSNPNDWEDITATVTDAIGAGWDCSVTNGVSQKVPKSDKITRDYSCSWTGSGSPSGGTNTATATWDASAASTPDGTASGTHDFAFTAPAHVTNKKVTVTDPAYSGGSPAGTLGTVEYGVDTLPKPFTYSHAVTGTPGTCTTFDNTATITETSQSDSAQVKLCVGANLTVGKTATGGFTRTYKWKIAKAPDATKKTALNGSIKFTYTVTVTSDTPAYVDSAWKVTGTITAYNPNDWEDVVANFGDSIGAGWTCTVASGSNVTVPKASGGTAGNASRNYSCTWAGSGTPAGGTNTATVSWNNSTASTPNASATGTATFSFSAPTTVVNKKITVTDPAAPGGTLGTVEYGVDTLPKKFTYDRYLAVPSSGCTTYPNTATITETGQSASASVQACRIPAATGALTMGFWQNKNGQGIITGGGSTGGVCNSGTFLRTYAPFQDLSASASCSAVATYVTNVIKAATASGAAMNAMLKAQMLATALDVYFSDPALGGNKIGAFNGLGAGQVPIGGIKIDLTVICKMTDSSAGTGTCSGVNSNASAAFGGATSMFVSELLTFAASQSNVGGTTWYGQVKATQELAKNTFDAINNQAAFGV